MIPRYAGIGNHITKDLLPSEFDEMNLDEIKVNVTNSLDKLKIYSGKVEL